MVAPVTNGVRLAMLLVVCLASIHAAAQSISNLDSLQTASQALRPRQIDSPGRAEVVFSTRWERPGALAVAKAFGATRVEWVYASSVDYVNKFKSSNIRFGCTLNANIKTKNDAGVARDFDGNPQVAPWMISWGAKWITTSHPTTRNAIFEEAEKSVAIGCDSIQYDDPLLQAATFAWSGGDFSEVSRAAFSRYLATLSTSERHSIPPALLASEFDYREYLVSTFGIRDQSTYALRAPTLSTTALWRRFHEDSVVQFFAQLRGHLDSYGGKRTPLSMNIGGASALTNVGVRLAKYADYFLVETRVADAGRAAFASAIARALGVAHVPSLLPTSVSETRRNLSTYYALGDTPLVPWDVYMGSDVSGSKPRYFATTQNYGDIFTFVRAKAHLFDGWESPPMVGVVLKVGDGYQKHAQAAASALASQNLPFMVLLAGGQQYGVQLDAARARALKLLVLPDELALSADDRGELHRLGVTVITGVPDAALLLRHVVPPLRWRGQDVPLMILKIPSGHGALRELAIHVVRGASDKGRTDRLTYGSSGVLISLGGLNATRISHASWHSPAADGQALSWQQEGEEVFIPIPGGSDFGVIHLRLKATS
jgi:hypothetical protein